MTITFRNKNGKLFEIVDNRQSPWGIVKPDMEIFYDTMPGNIGFLKIPSFRPNEFDMERFATLYDSLIVKTDGLIIDIRDNAGGNSTIGETIMRLLATDSIPQAPWETPRYDAAYSSWGQPWHTTSVPSKTIIPYHLQSENVAIYDKPIVLLINGNTFSAAEDFAVLFKNAKRGLLIGTPTGGSTGNPIIIDLGWGYYGRICTRHERLANGTEFIGVGIQPDIFVDESESVILGDDNVLKAALNTFK